MSVKKAAVIQDGVVVNTILVEVDNAQNVLNYETSEEKTLFVLPEDSTVSIGWAYVSGEFVEPEPPPLPEPPPEPEPEP